MVYANYYHFEGVFTSDPNVHVGTNDKTKRDPIAPRGIRGNVGKAVKGVWFYRRHFRSRQTLVVSVEAIPP